MNDQISPRQHIAAQLLAAGKTQTEAAQAAQVNERTVRAWNTNPYFQAAVNRLREAQLEEVRDGLRLALGTATKRLQTIIESEDDAVALRAVRLLLEHLRPFDLEGGAGVSIGSTIPEHLTGTLQGHRLPISSEELCYQEVQMLLEQFVDGHTDAATVQRAIGGAVSKEAAGVLIADADKLQSVVQKIIGLSPKPPKKANTPTV